MKKLLAAATLGIAALAVGVSSLAQGNKTFTVAWAGAITGPTSDAGSKYALGIADYCKYFSDKTPIAGWTIKCEIRDDNYDNSKTQRLLEEFVQNFKISAFLGYSTGGTLQVRGLLRELQIPTITASYHIGLLDGADGEYIYLPISSYSEQMVSLVEAVAKQNKNAKIAFVVNPSPFGRLPAQDARKAAEMLGITVAATDEVGGNNLDNTALLKRYESLGVTHIIHQNTYGPVANILKDAKRLGLSSKFEQMGAHYAGGDDLIALAGDAAQGFTWTTGFWLYDEADKEGMKMVREMATANKRSLPDASSVHYTSGAAAVAIFLEAARRAVAAKQDITNQTLQSQLQSMNGRNAYRSPFSLSTVTFDKNDHTGSQSLRLLEVNKGAWRVLSAGVVSPTFKKIRPGR